MFQIKRFDCALVSVHLKATGLANEDLSRLQQEIDKIRDLIDAIHDHLPGKIIAPLNRIEKSGYLFSDPRNNYVIQITTNLTCVVSNKRQ